MPFVVACTHAAAGLLVLSGGSKLWSPTATATALAALKVPGVGGTARLLGAGEIGVGGLALLVGGWIAGLAVATAYVGFAVVALVLRASADPVGCGCFGRASTPPTLLHAAVDLALAAAAAATLINPMQGVVRILGDQPLAGVPYVMLVVTAVALLHAVLTVLPETVAA
ncbi:MAG: MauE/DoxX family redox-associated membrane protein [Acidimicrobiales bacterium]